MENGPRIIQTITDFELYNTLGIMGIHVEEDGSVMFECANHAETFDEVKFTINRNDEYEVEFFQHTEPIDTLEGVSYDNLKEALINFIDNLKNDQLMSNMGC